MGRQDQEMYDRERSQRFEDNMKPCTIVKDNYIIITPIYESCRTGSHEVTRIAYGVVF
jgi:hypothetical protein